MRCRRGGGGCGVLAIGGVEFGGAEDVEGGIRGHCLKVISELRFREWKGDVLAGSVWTVVSLLAWSLVLVLW